MSDDALKQTLGTRVERIQQLIGPDGIDGGYAPVTSDGVRTYMCRTPNGHTGNLANHDVTEHDDGTITVSPSILVENSNGEGWHGYLERGVWREC